MRIIQDSEDEDDFELEPIAAGVQLPDASPDHSSTNDLAKPGEKGSGSTGMCCNNHCSSRAL